MVLVGTSMPVTLTLDSQIVLTRDADHAGRGSWLQQLRELGSAGLVALGISSRFIQDKLSDPDEPRRAQDLEEARRLEQLPAPFRFDESYWDGLDVLVDASDGTLDELESLFGVVPPDVGKRKNTLRDVDHLSTHWMCKRDYFVTCDKGILRKRKALAALGIRVVEPQSVLAAAEGSPCKFRERLEERWRESCDLRS